jgi:hypothetical protein
MVVVARVETPVVVKVPATVRRLDGVVVPIPTLPAKSIVIRSLLAVLNPIYSPVVPELFSSICMPTCIVSSLRIPRLRVLAFGLAPSPYIHGASLALKLELALEPICISPSLDNPLTTKAFEMVVVARVETPVVVKVPATVRRLDGLVVPIPTLPAK